MLSWLKEKINKKLVIIGNGNDGFRGIGDGSGGFRAESGHLGTRRGGSWGGVLTEVNPDPQLLAAGGGQVMRGLQGQDYNEQDYEDCVDYCDKVVDCCGKVVHSGGIKGKCAEQGGQAQVRSDALACIPSIHAVPCITVDSQPKTNT